MKVRKQPIYDTVLRYGINFYIRDGINDVVKVDIDGFILIFHSNLMIKCYFFFFFLKP